MPVMAANGSRLARQRVEDADGERLIEQLGNVGGIHPAKAGDLGIEAKLPTDGRASEDERDDAAGHVLVDAGQFPDFDGKAGFFLNLAAHAAGDRLVQFEDASGRFPATIVGAADHQSTALLVEDDPGNTDRVERLTHRASPFRYAARLRQLVYTSGGPRVPLGKVDRASDRSAFQQIADQLRVAVESGEFAPGSAVPSEVQLIEHYGVARMTVRQAVQVLKGEGLLVAEHGRGVFVRERPPVRRLAAGRFARANREQGRAAFAAETAAESRVGTVDRIHVSTETAPARIRALLQLGSRERVVVRDRRYLTDGKPVQTAVSYIPASIGRGTKIAEPNTGPGGVYARIEELGHTLARFTEEIDVRMPNQAESAALELAVGVPVIHLVRVAYDTGNLPVEVTDTVMASDAFVLTYEVPAT